MKLRNYILIMSVLFIAQKFGFALSSEGGRSNEKAVERFAVYIGSNRGGEGRETLRYAGSDAQKIASAMLEVGGMKSENSHILVDPSRADIDRLFGIISADLKAVSGTAKRTEFLFYYSGHSDESSLLLGEERYNYSDLKAAISKVPSEIHVVMLDSCFSGNFIRTKGGQRQKSFLVDDSSVVQGHAYLSSSSASESSQESDAIGSSFFTNSLVTGLRGAADTSGDNKVSLNELYYYAFNDTLYNTEDSAAGPQHPSYNITMVGSGDLVLTDISEAEAVLVLPDENDGRFLIRNESGALVSEVAKIAGTQIALALPAGRYSVTAVTPRTTLQSDVTLLRNFPVTLKQSKMAVIDRQKNTLRGDSEQNADGGETSAESGAESEEKSGFKNVIMVKEGEYGVIHLSVLPSVQFPKEPAENNIFSGILIAGKDKNIMGVQWSVLVSSVENSFTGWQHTGIAGQIKGTGYGFQEAGLFAKCADFYGAQTAGLACMAGDFTGFQASGIYNWADNTHGCQIAGIFNKADAFRGVAIAGIYNWVNNVNGWQIAGIFNKADIFDGWAVSGVGSWASNVSGWQLSGVVNKADNVTGVQTAGVVNAASKVRGVQLSGVLNAADSVEGVQIGVINYAKEYKGFPIGLINIVPGGICETGVYIDSDGNMAAQYQGGTKLLFTTLLAGTKITCSGDYGFYGLGLGTRINVIKNCSIDIEGLWKKIFAENRDVSNDDSLPSVRLTANIPLVKHIKFFVSGTADVRVENWNDKVFDDWTHHGKFASWTADGRDVCLYGGVQAGVKFSLK